MGDRASEGKTLNNLGLLYDGLGLKQKALDYYEQSLQVAREMGDFASEAAALVTIAVQLYWDVQRPKEAIANVEQALAIFHETGLTHDAAGFTREQIEHLLQVMRDDMLSKG